MAKKSVATRRIVLILFVAYVLAVLFLLLMPNNYRGHNVLVGGLTWERWKAYVQGNFNLVPLHGLKEQIDNIATGQVVVRNIVYLAGNLLGFSPLGFFLPTLFVRQRKFQIFLFTVLLAIALLELMQVMMMSGSCDIDDLILNTTGACVGFWLTRKAARAM